MHGHFAAAYKAASQEAEWAGHEVWEDVPAPVVEERVIRQPRVIFAVA
jgi:hypothetical protein